MISPRTAKVLQILLLVALVAAAVRLAFVVRERLKPGVAQPAPAKPGRLNPEAYVVPRKLFAYDLKSARQLTQQPAWIKEGYRYTYYPYDARHHRADFQHEAGTLGPLEELRISDVVSQPTPGARRHWQALAVFEKDGKTFAVPVGTQADNEFHIYADEMFFYEDPRQLYNFWPAQVWNDIRNHRVTPGMNEIQAAFAVGMGIPQPEGPEPEEKVVKYPNGGHPLVVTYRNGKAVEVKPGR